jgi:hypothetical protein
MKRIMTYSIQTTRAVTVGYNLKSRVLAVLQGHSDGLLVKWDMGQAEISQTLSADGRLQADVEVRAGIIAQAQENRHSGLRVVEGEVDRDRAFG